MKVILQLMDYAAPYKGNFIPSVLNLEQHINNSGGKMVYVFPEAASNINWVKQLQSKGKIIYFIDRSFFSKKIKYNNISCLMGIIKKEKVDIIHTHFVAYCYTLAVMKLFFIPKVKIAGNFMNEFLPPDNIYKRFKIFVTRIIFDKIIACSAAVKQSVLNTGINTKKVAVIYNALDINHLQTYDIINIKGSEHQKIILMFGWTFYRKGVDVAINAVNKLIEEKKNVKLVIAMAAGIEQMKNEILNLLGDFPSWITVLGPSLHIATYYNSADIFLSASREEGFTYSVLEASYCNPMIIVSEIGGHPLDVPFIGKFESENIGQLKVAINTMLKMTPDEIKIINEAQKEYVTKTYDINNWSEEIINLYKSFSE